MVTPGGKFDPLSKPEDCVTVTPAQLSLAVGLIQLTGASHIPGAVDMVILAGQLVKTGISASVTVMLNEQAATLPAASLASKTMLLVPIGKNDPLGKPVVWVIVTPGQLSVATGGTQLTTAPHKPGVLTTVIFDGQKLNTGG